MVLAPGFENRIGEQIEALHATLRAEFPAIDRVAVALYDPETDLLRTFAQSTVGGSPLAFYDATLEEVVSLKDLAARGGVRVLNDLALEIWNGSHHSQKLLEKGYLSSLTRPFYESGSLRGFLFFDAVARDYFQPATVRRLEVYSNLATLLVLGSLATARVLRAAVRMAGHIGQVRDRETGAHISRVSRYAKAIATGLAWEFGLTDEWIEFLCLFTPLHDIGKIGIPDHILLKEGPLSPEEFEVMRTHVAKGVELVDALAREFGVERLPQLSILRNIVQCHHERVDGGGYPRGLHGGQIPLEARIVTVADVYDGLLSPRPYKPAWTEDRVLDFMRDRAGTHFDSACVASLLGQWERLRAIRERFVEDGPGEATHEAYMPEL
ncbi:MAG: HD-GYP domain-containing protein [Holophagaceae bacterium]